MGSTRAGSEQDLDSDQPLPVPIGLRLTRSEQPMSPRRKETFYERITRERQMLPPPPSNRHVRIGYYDLEKTVGEGNFAKVKLATHTLTKAKVAVKIIEKRNLSPTALTRLEREVRLMKLLNHPHICRLYEVIDTPTELFLVMELAEGGELFDYLVAHGRMQEREARRHFRQIVSAVDYCHQKMIIHRDLKAENLLLDNRMNAKLADFGFSNQFQLDKHLRTWCGSPPYAAPELYQGKEYTGPEIDVWSLGVVLYVLVCGCLPFDAVDMAELRARILSGKFKVPFFMSPACERLIKRMLTVDPANRAKMSDVKARPRSAANLRKADPWLNEGFKQKLGDPAAVAVIMSPEQHEYVLVKMEQLGLPRDQVEQSLQSQDYNHVSATYHLICDIKFPRVPIQDKTLSAENIKGAAAPTPPSTRRLPFEDEVTDGDTEDDEEDDADLEMDAETLRYLESLPLPGGGKTGSLPMPASRKKIVAGKTAMAATPIQPSPEIKSPDVKSPEVAATTTGAPAAPAAATGARGAATRRPAPLVIPSERENGIVSASAIARPGATLSTLEDKAPSGPQSPVSPPRSPGPNGPSIVSLMSPRRGSARPSPGPPRPADIDHLRRDLLLSRKPSAPPPAIPRYASTDINSDPSGNGSNTAAAAEATLVEDAMFFDDNGLWRAEALQIFPWTSSSASTTRATLLTMLRANASDRPMMAASPPVLELPTSAKQRRFRAKTLGEAAVSKQTIAAIVAAGPPGASGGTGPSPPASTSAVNSPGGSTSPPHSEHHLASRNVSSEMGISSSGSGQLSSIREEPEEGDDVGTGPTKGAATLLVPGPSQPRSLSPRTAMPGISQSEDRMAPRPLAVSRDPSTEMPRPSSPASSSSNKWMPTNMQASSVAGSSSGAVSPRAMASPSSSSLFSFRALRDRLRGSNPSSPAAQPPSRVGELQPRTLRFLFSKATTSNRDAQHLILEVEQTLLVAGVLFERTGFIFLCKASVRRRRAELRRGVRSMSAHRYRMTGEEGRLDRAGQDACFEIEVCKLPRLPLRALRFKRLDGDSWRYKAVCTRIIEQLHL